MLRISEAAVYLGVSASSLRRWDKNGTLQAYRTAGRHRRYTIDQLTSFYHKDSSDYGDQKGVKKHVLCYARVSSHKQKDKGDLGRQLQKLAEEAENQGDSHPICIHDVGSGLNARRSGLAKLFRLVRAGEISTLLVTYRDRLTRFGFPFIREYCDLFGVSIIETEQLGEKSVQQSLVDDMMALIACFSGKLYGMRSATQRRKMSFKRKIQYSIEKSIQRETEKALNRAISRVLTS